MPHYFLGANSKDGFFSLYREFPPDPSAFLHVIKGGPGTGKSSLLKRIAREAEARGHTVQKILCSGDPDSLDGVYLPSLGLAWVDGTAPHVVEPGLFGATGDYLNLTRFFVSPFSPEEKAQLKTLQHAYQQKYREAYAYLHACAALGGDRTAACPNDELFRAMEALPQLDTPGQISRRFLSAISCKGWLRLEEEWNGFARISATPEGMRDAAETARRKGWCSILCPSPLNPQQPECLLLPEQRLVFTALAAPKPDSIPLLEKALATLREAKALHDELESFYRPHMDFAALSQYTEQLIASLFST